MIPKQLPEAKPAQPDAGRRRFLRAATGAGALAAMPCESKAVQAVPVEAPGDPGNERGYRGYHETPHIRTYYRTAAYW